MASIFTTQRDTIHIIIFLLIKPKNSTTMIFVMRKILKGNNNKRQWKRHNIVNAEAIVRQNIIDKWLNTASSPEKIEIQLNKITAWFWLFSIVFPRSPSLSLLMLLLWLKSYQETIFLFNSIAIDNWRETWGAKIWEIYYKFFFIRLKWFPWNRNNSSIFLEEFLAL